MDETTPVNNYETIKNRLKFIYKRKFKEETYNEIVTLIENYNQEVSPIEGKEWDQSTNILITYGNSIQSKDGYRPLENLNAFLNKYVKDFITGVHILPYFPYTSDDGFSVKDYKEVDPELGDWEHVSEIAKEFILMSDFVLNHVSSQSDWFKQFLKGEAPGKDYFICYDKNVDTSMVIRPRSSPLLIPVGTKNGLKKVWATFSEDQIDLNFENPDVLIEMIKVLLHYISKGSKYIRLDAVGFLWKELGTTCMHLPETHEVIKLFRDILDSIRDDCAIITETNVPNRENLSYFGNRNEAHMIYNFSLPPLLINSLIRGSCEHLKTWMMSMPPAPHGCSYFNFTASHDGIGLRPAEGLIEGAELGDLINSMKEFGAKINMRSKPDGSESPYEINITFFDACKGTVDGPDEYQIDRFICSQAIMMSIEGIPAFYIHSLFGTENDYQGVEEKKYNRAINRKILDKRELFDRIGDPNFHQHHVFVRMKNLIEIRSKQPAFHPNATQYTLQLGDQLFGFWRQSRERDQSIFCIFNVSDKTQPLSLRELNLVELDEWADLISGKKFDSLNKELKVVPYQALWITNLF